MEISPDEAKEALAAIEVIVRKTRRSIATSGANDFLIVWGAIWLLGFLNSQFMPVEIAGNIWIVLDILGGIISAVIGIRMNRGVRNPETIHSGKRIALFWLLLFFFCFAASLVAWPLDGKQLAMFIILFVSIGWIAMGLLLSFASVWWGLALVVLSLIGYFVFPAIFYIWMAILGGGGMIALGLYIRSRW